MIDFYRAIRSDWQKLAQKRELDRRNSPASPLVEEVGVFNKFLQKINKNKLSKNKKALVLGVTPEMRQLAFKYSYKLVSVDIDKNMIKAMKKFVKKRGKERIINDNWLNLKKYFSDSVFDMILADGSFNNLAFDDYARLFKILHKLLKNDGVFVIRHFIIAEKNSLKPINYFCRKKVFWKEKLLGMLLGVEQIGKWMNYKERYLNLGIFYKWALTQSNKGCLSKDMKIVRSYTSNRNLSVQTEKDFLNMSGKYFELINKGNDCNFGSTPIFVFKKK